MIDFIDRDSDRRENIPHFRDPKLRRDKDFVDLSSGRDSSIAH